MKYTFQTASFPPDLRANVIRQLEPIVAAELRELDERMAHIRNSSRVMEEFYAWKSATAALIESIRNGQEVDASKLPNSVAQKACDILYWAPIRHKRYQDEDQAAGLV
jgi:hypothetical protein